MTDDFFRSADQFPLGQLAQSLLGATADLRDIDDQDTNGRELRPFGLRFAVNPSKADGDDLNFAALDYDADRQIAIVRDGGAVLPAFKHTSGQTSTDTAAHDRNAGDKDTDTEQD